MSLPAPAENQAFCNVSALEAGYLDLPDHMFITGVQPGNATHAPSLAFLITHSKRPEKFVFDLGIRRDWGNYTPATVRWIKEVYPCVVPQNVIESLAKGGLSPTDVDTVCLSHLHWDHVGDVEPFTKSTFVVGGESLGLLKTGYPTDPNSRFDEHLLPLDRTRFLDDRTQWAQLGPFPRAFDFYGDGSLYIVDAPGHLPGHINVVARTSADGGWICLAGDSAHHCKLVTGEAHIAVGASGHGPAACAHADKASADFHLTMIRSLFRTPRVRVVLAHDTPFRKEQPDAFWPGRIASL
ncbi:hypothetical protein HGRIS_004076 [Hohenbuehelia grisea]|uniref:Metallo-beta-lactamase domain-containing protein n=1 Tax=Hohenbuehelia grisea TaxID=104357 RepID=A0ABR3JIB9_9AGAR